jgi:uncharacterized protein
MVIEGVLTTEDANGAMHVSPIGPHVDAELNSWTLKPFQSSTTFVNLRASSRAVFHVVDDPLLMAAAVLGLCNPTAQLDRTPDSMDAEQLDALVAAEYQPEIGWVLGLSCSFYALTVQQWDVSNPRAIAHCSLRSRVEKRPFWGWNRAKHSILELAIIASRVQMLERSVIDDELNRHRIIIEKTAGPREMAAWELLKKHLSR